ncbi:UdgX family uracil-DNA binding protein [Hyalangium rubrum]|uniref:Type-4 uracil-DNA glycosylase n=1 Tax=Hyalangium rubrum TaxID=3103134 RepID=A0ABU5H639_9BACT|nr:UdgX family uracil-DNA binding protein [Hyalangium sp. s54d21]MDY7228721.1 UdgX family uracil-DNA binding protein [Hyalangium sp. s54d21]
MPKRPSAQETAAPLIPQSPTLDKLREAAAGCRACPLWKTGTQTVFGEREGRPQAGPRVMFVGEQPGDQEDKAGKPFVGPSGRLLNEALETVGIDRRQVYVTNTVKHFKWEAHGKRRLHAKPSYGEIRACKPWLEAEIRVFRPDVIVCLGATAAQALLGKDFRVTRQRGQPLPSEYARVVVATVHPSSILRAPSAEDRRQQLAAFIQDLNGVARVLRDLDAREGVSAHP